MIPPEPALPAAEVRQPPHVDAPSLPPELPRVIAEPPPPPALPAAELTPAAAISNLPIAVEPPPLVIAEAPPPVAPSYAGAEPCTNAQMGTSPVADACRREGQAGAKAVMKQMVHDGWAAGLAMTCDDCHLDRTDLSRLNPEAGARFAQLLAAFNTQR